MRESSRPTVHGLYALLLFGIFALCVLSVLLTAARVYSRVARRDEDACLRRTAVQYLATKVRQAEGDAISLASFGGGDALVIPQEIDGQTYLTRIYCWDGSLRELFSAADAGLTPEDGEVILPAQSLTLEETDGLLTVTLTDTGGSPRTLTLSIRGRGGSDP